MIISGNVISASEIIGIGALMCQKNGDPVSNIRQLSYTLYLKYYSVKIESGWLDVGYGDAPDAKEKEARKLFLEFTKEHKSCVAAIEKLIKSGDRKDGLRTVAPKKKPVKA